MGICDPGEIFKTNSKALKEYAKKKTINSSGLSESKTNQIQGENFILKFKKKNESEFLKRVLRNKILNKTFSLLKKTSAI